LHTEEDGQALGSRPEHWLLEYLVFLLIVYCLRVAELTLIALCSPCAPAAAAGGAVGGGMLT